jgi:hypothetical protein
MPDTQADPLDGDHRPAPPRRRGAAAGLIVLAWCAIVAIAATAGWLVVDRAGSSLLEASGLSLPAGGGAQPTPSSTLTGASHGTGSLTTTGGRVSASCTPQGRISLQLAIPASTWRVQVREPGPTRLRVEFSSGARQVEVEGVCRAGAAVLTLGDDAASGSGGSSPTSAPARITQPGVDDHGGGTKGGGSSTSTSGKGGSGGSGKSSGGSDDSGGDKSGGH